MPVLMHLLMQGIRTGFTCVFTTDLPQPQHPYEAGHFIIDISKVSLLMHAFDKSSAISRNEMAPISREILPPSTIIIIFVWWKKERCHREGDRPRPLFSRSSRFFPNSAPK